ncbi:MAG: polymer-forming cytoskeletal protein [Chitinophagales bacterium]|nr:polymer-forming cytoskeletal protein [Chitinophagales bacterium]MCO5280253.1 polymer-forming cytoskeletal protein [Chitinophagales bacterium]HRN94912.1 polymer-forming cytoskeletal protein [Chitinophagales bacterium]HRP39422.1 polymer-forming cytoskeletal protein [Chitinophagales bacterium]
MFNKKDTTQDKLAIQKAMTMFGQGTQIEGNANSDGDIRVDGEVKGSLTSKSKIVVGVTGIVNGDIYCQNATIEGKVNGNIYVSELLILTKSALVTGDIQLKKLVVEEGARFSGKCSMGNLKVNRNEENLAKAL